ncbi:MAG: heme-binding beta-barrel domain-containing protein, partial [Gammaproteobacteria bacterium]|nr:heme-binding beta-barrel domain-containing protein [Gammaproteobacteria bacterium]
MNSQTSIDYGPLAALIGTWQGDKGIDIAPESDGTETNPYFETIRFEAIGDVTNAEKQVLTALHYRQIVSRHSNQQVFHDETGYWMWDSVQQIVMHSLQIPRAVSLIAGGKFSDKQEADSIC